MSKPALTQRWIAAASRWRHLPLAALLALSGVLLTVWAFSVPLGEGPDEPDHIAYANYIHAHHALPPYNTRYVEGNEPPLYYALIAPVVDRVFITVPDTRTAADGHLTLVHPPAQWKHSQDEVTVYAHLYLARLLTVGLSLLTVAFTYLAGLELAGRRIEALLAGGMVALLPQFSFRGMTISCDALVLTLCAATTWAAVRLARRGFAWRGGLLAAVLLGLGGLAKVTALGLLPALLLVILAEPRLSLRKRIVHLAVLGVVPLLLAPYLVRNQLLYGDPLAARALFSAVPGAIVHHSLFSSYFVGPFPTLLVQSFFARFGWMNLPVPLPVMIVLVAPALVGLAALPRAIRLSEQRRLLLLLVTTPVTALVALVGFNLSVSQPQGRYLFPALPAMAVLAAMLYRHVPGWAARQRALLPPLMGAYAVVNFAVLFELVRPAYAA